MAAEFITSMTIGDKVFPVAPINLGDAQGAWAAFEVVTADKRADAIRAVSRQLVAIARAGSDELNRAADTLGTAGWNPVTFFGIDGVTEIIKLVGDIPEPTSGGPRLAAMFTVLWCVARAADPSVRPEQIKEARGVNPANLYDIGFLRDLGRLLGYQYAGDSDEPAPGEAGPDAAPAA